MTTNDQLSPDFTAAVARHEQCLAEFGEDDPRTQEAIYHVMLLAPWWLFLEMEEVANAPRH